MVTGVVYVLHNNIRKKFKAIITKETKHKSSLEVYFPSCHHVKVNQNFKILLSHCLKFKFGSIFCADMHYEKRYF